MEDILEIIMLIIFICIVIGVVKYLVTTYKTFRIVVAILMIVVGFMLMPTFIGIPLGKFIAQGGAKLIEKDFQ